MVTEWWKNKIAKRIAEDELLRKKLKITIYGSFEPSNQKQELEKLCNHLCSKGFEDTDIISGEKRPIPEDFSILEACLFYLEESDANFLVYTTDGARQGLITECDHILFSPKMCKKWGSCLIMDQTKAQKSSMGQLQKDRLAELNSPQLTRIAYVPFSSFKELQMIASNFAENFFVALKPILIDR